MKFFCFNYLIFIKISSLYLLFNLYEKIKDFNIMFLNIIRNLLS